MYTITFNLHSFVDIITNSSSEIFIAANSSTVNTVKEIIDSLLKQGGSEKTCDDLFKVDRVIPKGTYFRNPDYDEDIDDSEEEIELEYDVSAETPEFDKYKGWKEDSGYPQLKVSLRVTAKNDDPETIKVAKMFEKIIGTYTIEELYNY